MRATSTHEGLAMRLVASLTVAAMLIASNFAPAATAQQEKMKTCNADATAQQLKGDERQAFMKTCLSGKQLTPQQQKMSDCSKKAAAQQLAMESRKKFMSECLKSK
jgi:hypothetical protein